MSGVRVVHITSVHRRSDVRIFFKECRALANAGFDVTLVVADGLGDEIVEGVNIYDVGTSGGRLSRMLLSGWRVYRRALSLKAAVCHFHDPELLPFGLLLRLRGAKVIYDVHEDLPRQILSKPWIPGPLRRLISFFAALFEKAGGVFCSALVTVTPVIAARFPQKKTFLVRNFVDLSRIDAAKALTSLKTSGKKKRYVLIYPGALSEKRGILDLIRTMELLPPEAELWLFGKWENAGTEKRAMAEKGWNRVKYRGRLAPEELYGYLKAADVGLQMVHHTPNYREGMYPLKAFEYMACSIPFVISDTPRRREIFAECALFAEPENIRDIADKITLLLNDKRLARRLGSRGREMVEAEYNWGNESRILVDLYRNLLGS